MKPILFVDDDANLLNGLRRRMSKVLKLEVAEGGKEALKRLADGKSYAVIVADMRMPGIDGIQVLKTFAKQSPETVRIMLTGNADQETAMNAINESNIFRFLTKPCPAEMLAKAIHDGMQQYKLQTAEKELLHGTLSGSVKMLMDLLETVDSEAFSQTNRLRNWSEMTASRMGGIALWEIRLAAMLSQIGWVTVPEDLAARWRAGLDDQAGGATYEKAFESMAMFSSELVRNIPRLDPVADMILYQAASHHAASAVEVPLGARILKLLFDGLHMGGGGYPHPQAFSEMAANENLYDPKVAASAHAALLDIAKIEDVGRETAIFSRDISGLLPGDTLLVDITKKKSGELALSGGHVLTMAQIKRLQAMDKITPLNGNIRVERPVLS